MKTKYLILTALFAALTAAGSLIKIPAPIAPITLQVFFVMASGMLLGRTFGLLSMVLYAFMGLIGLPIFSTGGGIGYILTPTFGFIVGFMASAWFVGWLSEGRKDFKRLLLACLCGTAVMYIIAIPYMYLIMNLYLDKGFSLWKILQIGMLVYLPGDIIKCILCALLGSRLPLSLRIPAESQFKKDKANNSSL